MDRSQTCQRQRISHDILFISDLDGVVTDAKSKEQRLDRRAFDELLSTSSGHALAFATGRPFSWVEQNVIIKGGLDDSQAES